MNPNHSKVEAAVACFTDGFSCSQAVFSTYAAPLGLASETALKIAENFAMGMGRGETCGAVTGALMVIGLKNGRTQANDQAAKDKSRGTAKEFIARFTAQNLAITCNQLVGDDVSTPEGKEAVEAKGIFKTRCPLLVRSAATILEELL